jgi:Putative prokaryotic signal transducing protein
MRQLLKTNDPVLISFVEDLLSQNGIKAIVLDQNMSVMEGSIGVLPRRVMVVDDELDAAKRILKEADLGEWLKPDDTSG